MGEDARRWIHAPTIREKVIAELDNLRDEEVAQLLDFVLTLKAEAEHLADYDPAHDSILTGEELFDGPGNLSEHDEEILYGETRDRDDRAS